MIEACQTFGKYKSATINVVVQDLFCDVWAIFNLHLVPSYTSQCLKEYAHEVQVITRQQCSSWLVCEFRTATGSLGSPIVKSALRLLWSKFLVPSHEVGHRQDCFSWLFKYLRSLKGNRNMTTLQIHTCLFKAFRKRESAIVKPWLHALVINYKIRQLTDNWRRPSPGLLFVTSKMHVWV